MKPFEIYEGSDEETPQTRRNLDAAFVLYDDDSSSSEPEDTDRTLWNLLEASNERLSPESQARLSTPTRRASLPADIVTPIKALSFEQTDSADPFTPQATPMRSSSSTTASPVRVRPVAFPRTRLQMDPARDTVIVKTPSSSSRGEEKQSLIMKMPGAGAIDTTRNLVKVLSGATLMTHVLDKDGETEVVVSERMPVVKNHGRKGITCKFMRIAPVSRVENADAVRPNLFDPVNVNAPEHLGVFTVIPAYFRGTRRQQGDVVTVEPCNLMYSLAGSDVTVVQPGTVEHVSTVNHVIMTLMAPVAGFRGPQTILKLAIHKRVWAYGLQRLEDTLYFVNIPFRGMTGETFDLAVSTKIIAAAPNGASADAKKASIAYVFITGVKLTFPPSVRTLAVEQVTVPAGAAAATTGQKTPAFRMRTLFPEDQ